MRNPLLLLVFFGFETLVAQPSVRELRQLYYKASQDEAIAISMAKQLENTTIAQGHVLYGYKAMSMFVVCKHLSNPYKKWVTFQEGKATLEQAISACPHCIELRFLRFSVQINLPNLLQYKSDIPNDKKQLVEHLLGKDANNDLELKCKIKELLLLSTYCSQTERNMIINLN